MSSKLIKYSSWPQVLHQNILRKIFACRNFWRQQLLYGDHQKYRQKMVENSDTEITIFFKAFDSETVWHHILTNPRSCRFKNTSEIDSPYLERRSRHSHQSHNDFRLVSGQKSAIFRLQTLSLRALPWSNKLQFKTQNLQKTLLSARDYNCLPIFAI